MSNLRYRLLPVVCIAASATLAAVQMTLPAGRSSGFWFSATMVTKLLAFVGALAAAFAFERGDYLRRAWLLIAANYGFITFNSFLFGGNNSRGSFFGWHPNLLGLNPVLAGQLNWLSIILGNVLAVIGAVMLARAWSVAGLERSGSPARRWLVIIGAVAIAAALTGGPIAHSITNGLHNGFGLRFFMGFVTSGSDGLCFALVAPVLLTALALRGGVLWWPWVLYTGSGLSWMVFDVLISAGQRDTRLPIVVTISGALRALACLLSCAAGLAQRWAVTEKR